MSVAPQNDEYHACSMAYHDCSLRHQWRRYYHDWYQRTGDELRFSPGALYSLMII